MGAARTCGRTGGIKATVSCLVKLHGRTIVFEVGYSYGDLCDQISGFLDSDRRRHDTLACQVVGVDLDVACGVVRTNFEVRHYLDSAISEAIRKITPAANIRRRVFKRQTNVTALPGR